jgi:hypothetical protein
VGAARAQQPDTPSDTPPAVSIETPASPPPPAPAEEPPANMAAPSNDVIETPAPRPPAPVVKATPPSGPPRPVRSPVAVLRVLDKVTAETLRFEAPIGRRVRYKNLIFTVKACETRGPSDPQPRPSAYVVIESQSAALPDRSAPASKEVFRGWMFANRPGLNPFEHPVYDAWLDVCKDAPSPA